MMHVEVERPAVDIVFADEPRLVSLIDSRFEALALLDVFAAHVNVAGVSAHRERSDQRPFDQRVRVVAHDLPVLAGPGLGFVGVDDEVMRALGIDGLRHE